MKMIFGIFFIVTIFALASATNKGDDTLLSALSKEREEVKNLLRDETKQLREENTKLQQEDGALRRRIEQLEEQNVKMRDEKLQDENAQLKKAIQKIRHADRRQRRKEKKSKDSNRQDDAVLESKRSKSQTNNFLKEQSYDGYKWKNNAKAIAEVVFTNGSAHATSHNSVHSPAKAFINGNRDKNYWHSGGENQNYGVFPKMIWYDFSTGNGFVPARITFQGAKRNAGDVIYTPSSWEFVGSNDEVCSKSGDWTILCRDYSDVQPRDMYMIQRCDVEGEAQQKFRCLGINVLRTHSGWSLVSNIRMWRKA